VKKIIIVEEDTTSSQKNIVAEFFSIQFNYGLYDFNADKIFNDLERLYNIRLVETRLPYYTLIDQNGGVITALFKEEYV
jgi:hypothetical protein